MRRFALLVALGLEIIVLAGCDTVALLGPVPLDADRPALKCDFMAANEFRQVDQTASDGCPGYRIGMPLRPGMVLHLATPTWGPSLGRDVVQMDQGSFPAVDVSLSIGNRQPQLAAPMRLAVRTLGDAGHLSPEEIMVLGAIISLQRKTLFGAARENEIDVENTSFKWQKMLSSSEARRVLWNAFVASASLRRVSANDSRALALVLSPSTFCERAKALPRDQYDLVRTGLFPQDCVKNGKNIEAFGLATDASRADPLQAVVSSRKQNSGSPFYLGQPILFNPASVVLAEMNALKFPGEGAEKRWSLTEWEQSGACADRKISSFTIPGSFSPYRVIRGHDESATFRVEEAVSRNGLVRKLKRVSEGLVIEPTVHESDLRKLWPGDVERVHWSAPPNVSVPNSCEGGGR